MDTIDSRSETESIIDNSQLLAKTKLMKLNKVSKIFQPDREIIPAPPSLRTKELTV